ncbi:hypothetical protein [uncultured Aquimarina sp.]|uniref:hypothetical protein n=1 Tax=uncultured Aquimarina sp. TaxID=575652 RepID=UPI0026276D70|nr:hypothetical protein [uncultured Aquimarina sp.]
MKPWKDFREINTVLALAKNTLEKVSFLLVRFLWTSKENEQKVKEKEWFLK